MLVWIFLLAFSIERFGNDLSRLTGAFYHYHVIDLCAFVTLSRVATGLPLSKGAATRFDSLVRSLAIALYIGQS